MSATSRWTGRKYTAAKPRKGMCMLLAYVYVGTLVLCILSIVYFVVTDIIDRVHDRKFND